MAYYSGGRSKLKLTYMEKVYKGAHADFNFDIDTTERHSQEWENWTQLMLSFGAPSYLYKWCHGN